MNRLDRYIARRYLANCVALFVALFAFVISVDVFLNLRRYINAAGDLDPHGSGLKTAAATALAVIDLWGPRLLQLFNYLSGLVIVLAAGFTGASMVRRRELVAALASGISLQRLSAPMALAATLVIGAQAINQEFFLPRVAHLLPRDVNDVGRREIKPFRVSLLSDGAGRLFHAAVFEPRRKLMRDVTIWERDAAGHVVRRIHADEAHWTGDAWALSDGLAERPGSPGARETIGRIETDLDPTAILVRQVSGFGQSLSWRQISSALAQKKTPIAPKTRRQLERIGFGRAAIMLSDILTLLIAIPFFVSRTPVNMAVRTFRVAPVIAVAMIGSVIGVATPLPGVPVQLAVFFPSIVLAPMAIAALTSMKT